MILVLWCPGVGRRTARHKAMRSLLSRMAASISIGHRSVKTTQAYYCQKSLDTVNSEVLPAMDDFVYPLHELLVGLFSLWRKADAFMTVIAVVQCNQTTIRHP